MILPSTVDVSTASDEEIIEGYLKDGGTRDSAEAYLAIIRGKADFFVD